MHSLFKTFVCFSTFPEILTNMAKLMYRKLNNRFLLNLKYTLYTKINRDFKILYQKDPHPSIAWLTFCYMN